MIVAIDVGNTSTEFALIDAGRIRSTLRVATRELDKEEVTQIQKRLPGKNVEAVIVTSVVPGRNDDLMRWSADAWRSPARLVGKDLAPPIRNCYKNPKQVGMDRLMNAVAVHETYGADTIVLDFGTAITFDVVSAKGEYLGGVIAPGIEISLQALFERTALLPKAKLTKPKAVIGRDTEESIRSGCSYGIGGLCDRIVDEINRSMKRKFRVVATGGYARYMAQYCKSIETIEPDLVLKGIWSTYQHSRL